MRQSAASIITGNTIQASDFNNEYNLIASFADGGTGHDHSGGTGLGPKLSLTAAVTGILPTTNGGTGVANNVASTLTITGAYSLGLTLSGNTSVTLPTSGTLVTTANNLSVFAATSSAQLASIISDETGSGALVFGTSPTISGATLTTPSLGVATATSINKVAFTAPATSATITVPDGTTATFQGPDTYVGRATTDTLTNKTLTSPTLTTPNLGVATATSINKVAFTAPATNATLTIAEGKTLTASNTLTFTGTDASSIAFGTGGTVVYTGVTSLGSLTSAAALATVGTITSGTWSATAIAVNKGGTGLGTLPLNNVILGNGTSTPLFVAPGTSGNVLTSDGTTWNSTAASIPATTVSYGSINGCLISSIAGNSTTASFSIGTGQVADSSNTVYITSIGYSWAAANGNAINGTDAAAATLANSTTYHVFICKGGSGIGSFVSASLTPTFPTGYATYSRRIGSFNTTVAGAPIAYTSIEINGGGTLNYLTTQILDITVATLSTTRTAYSLTVPSGVKVQPIFRTNISANTVIITSGDEVDIAPSALAANWTTLPGYDLIGNFENSLISTGPWTTNTSGQINMRASASSTGVYLVTRGFIDFRRG